MPTSDGSSSSVASRTYAAVKRPPASNVLSLGQRGPSGAGGVEDQPARPAQLVQHVARVALVPVVRKDLELLLGGGQMVEGGEDRRRRADHVLQPNVHQDRARDALGQIH